MQEHNLFKNKIKQTKTFIGPNLRSFATTKKLSLKKTILKLMVNNFI